MWLEKATLAFEFLSFAVTCIWLPHRQTYVQREANPLSVSILVCGKKSTYRGTVNLFTLAGTQCTVSKASITVFFYLIFY